ncbi:MAG TPA: CDP-alcohol phosphatidyltransferase family protein [Candidatus Saccharimonadales bacterium]|nr:CDP-alcohol phosphatidyltransferase family protein [Candidatus Saccharimonadales bacterium]
MSLKWLPNFLSSSRGVLAIGVATYGLEGQWTIGFWIFIAALMTDFLDGLAAKLLHAESPIGGHIDRVSDFLLCAGGISGLVFSHNLALWIGLTMLGFGILAGIIIFFVPTTNTLNRFHSALAVPFLFSVWTLIAWDYATLAFGWKWQYIPLTIAILSLGGMLKRHRLAAWYPWFFARTPASPRKS